MKNIIYNNKLIFIFLFAAIVYTCNYMAYSSTDDMFSTLYVISLSYIVADIFYVLQVIVPETKGIKSVNRVLESRLNNIIKYVNRLYQLN